MQGVDSVVLCSERSREGDEGMLRRGLVGVCLMGEVEGELGENGGAGNRSKADKALT